MVICLFLVFSHLLVSQKIDLFKTEITLEIFSVRNQFGYFCKAEKCSYLANKRLLRN